MREKFTYEQAYEIQQQQIEEWAQVLKPEMTQRLREEATRQNQLTVSSGLKDEELARNVWRGTSINEFIHNVLIRTERNKIFGRTLS